MSITTPDSRVAFFNREEAIQNSFYEKNYWLNRGSAVICALITVASVLLPVAVFTQCLAMILTALAVSKIVLSVAERQTQEIKDKRITLREWCAIGPLASAMGLIFFPTQSLQFLEWSFIGYFVLNDTVSILLSIKRANSKQAQFNRATANNVETIVIRCLDFAVSITALHLIVNGQDSVDTDYMVRSIVALKIILMAFPSLPAMKPFKG